jgi:16S rRNA (adenine1518-N6/adenine1519-N6)-dimethyltransferase
VLEIGPGLGFLTRFLSTTSANITAVELDRDCVADLEDQHYGNVSITHGDFLGFDIGTVGDTIKLVGNVPYQITTPIIAHIFGEIGEPQPWLSKVERVVLTVQYEVAQRLVAEPRSEHYSQITILVNYFAKARLLKRVPLDSFYPPPRVNSAVVEFIPLKEPPIKCKDIKMLRQVIKAGFGQRRKMLKNNLSFLQADEDVLHEAIARAHVNLQDRAENLSLEQFAALADSFLDIDMRNRKQ